VLNGRAQPYRADAPATLTFQVRGIYTAAEILLNGKPLGTVAANTPTKTVLNFPVPSDRLAKVNRVTIRAGGPFYVQSVNLKYKKDVICDPRYYRGWEGHHAVAKATSASSRPEDVLYFCLP
jgi:hypothetical protein